MSETVEPITNHAHSACPLRAGWECAYALAHDLGDLLSDGERGQVARAVAASPSTIHPRLAERMIRLWQRLAGGRT